MNLKRVVALDAVSVRDGMAWFINGGVSYDLADALSEIEELIPSTIMRFEAARQEQELKSKIHGG